MKQNCRGYRAGDQNEGVAFLMKLEELLSKLIQMI